MDRDHGVPEITLLSDDECRALLARQQVGRLAFTFKDRVDIEPIHFVFADDCLYGRTQAGRKVEILSHHPWVAFEADDVKGLFDWESVVVHGRIVFPDAEGAPTQQALHARAVTAVRTLIPDAFTESDPTTQRDMVFCIHVQSMTGRVARSGSRGGEPTNG